MQQKKSKKLHFSPFLQPLVPVTERIVPEQLGEISGLAQETVG